jgi:hypothetical protein
MKITDFDEVKGLMEKHRQLRLSYDFIAEGDSNNSKFGITIFGRYQDDAMIDACRRPALMEMLRRIDEVEAQLTRLGVNVGE